MKVPTVVAIFVVMTSIYLVLAPIIHYPRVEFLYAALFIASGLFLYFPFVYYKQCRLPLDPYIGKWVTCESLKFTNTCANLSDRNTDWKNWNKPPIIVYLWLSIVSWFYFFFIISDWVTIKIQKALLVIPWRFCIHEIPHRNSV